MQTLTPIDQPTSLAKMALEAIRNSILSGEMKTSEVYNEIAIAKELQISRTPVREALLELATRGLVTFIPRKGVKINEFTQNDISDIFELRKAIELAAIEKVCRFVGEIDVNSVGTILGDQRRACEREDFQEFMNQDRIFHLKFGELTGNKRMLNVMQDIRDMVHLMGIRALASQGRMEEVMVEHELVFQAVQQGKAMEARVLMETHLEKSREAVEKILEETVKE